MKDRQTDGKGRGGEAGTNQSERQIDSQTERTLRGGVVPIRAEWRGGLVKWDVIRGVSGSVKGLIRGCVVDNGCGSD